jgi:hypothetical protein
MLGLYAVRELGRGYAPNNFCWKLITMATASVMEVQAAYTYPSRLETGRLVMFYDERVTRPQRDAEVMEKHVARLEAMTGRPLRAKIHWVRGRLLGRENMACRGLALGSAQSPDDWESADHPDGLSVDRHELAHAVLHQLCQPDIDPPFLFAEGWADSQAGPRSSKLASWALGSRDVWRERSGLGEHVEGSYLKELVGPSWYHRIGGPVYNVGGAFVDHLLRRYGAARFLELYFACKQDTFEADFRSVIGEDLDVVERRFWDEAEKLAGPAGTVTR